MYVEIHTKHTCTHILYNTLCGTRIKISSTVKYSLLWSKLVTHMQSWACTNLQYLDVYRQRWTLSLCYFYSFFVFCFLKSRNTLCSPLSLYLSLRSSSQTHSLLRKERLGDGRGERRRECDRKRKSRERRGSQVRQDGNYQLCEWRMCRCVCVSVHADETKWQFKRINIFFSLYLQFDWQTACAVVIQWQHSGTVLSSIRTRQ